MRTANRQESTLRIIGGRWRGRRVSFAPRGVRPTGDRVRETLFNWLQPTIAGARCLDLFAGSGALGLEALSRGAGFVVFVDRDGRLVQGIRKHLVEFGADNATVLQAAAERVDFNAYGPFDVVFLDPPFQDGPVLTDLCTLLESSGALRPGCLVYLEMNRARTLVGLPDNWEVLRDKTAGQVRYALANRCETEQGE